MDSASKATLENEFGTHNDEEVIKQILEKGTLQETEVRIPHPFSFLPSISISSHKKSLILTVPPTGSRETRLQERQHGFPSCTLDMLARGLHMGL